jgi:hypothetical protein
VQWAVVDDADHDDSDGHGDTASIRLNFAFPAVDWAFQQSVYGWAALQYQAFARGFITVMGHDSCRVAFYSDNILELAVNDQPFFGGDFYGFRRAPVVLNLTPGDNRIDLRLILDVRDMGGVGEPSISVRLSVQLCSEILNVVEKSAVAPDLVNGKLTSSYASIIVRNESDDWVQITSIQNCIVSICAFVVFASSG